MDGSFLNLLPLLVDSVSPALAWEMRERMKMTLKEKFDAVSDGEYLKFDRIPLAERRHPVKEICAFLYLHEKAGARPTHDKDGFCNIIAGAAHDIIYLDFDEGRGAALTQEDAQYLSRCGVMFDDDSDSLAMFV